MLGQNISPAALLQGRSPSLDLDSLYGAGPSDPESAKFYSDDRHLKMGTTLAEGGLPAKAGFDLPRGMGNTAAKKRKAVIPDPRNDENLAVAQTHLAMIRFHNRVVDTLPAATPAAERFEKAREIVTKHYQWMIRTDYLKRICQPGVVSNVFNDGRKAFEVGVPATDVPTMPIEFSVAAFRLGHSMIRREYNWNAIFDFGGGSLELLFLFSAGSRDLAGGPRLPSTWIADWRRLYDFKEANKPGLAVPANQFNRAMRIDTTLVNPLKTLPTGSFGGPNVPQNDPRRNLAFRNLTRAKMVKLATGQQMATFLKNKGVNVTKLTKTQLRDGKNGADLEPAHAIAARGVPEGHPAVVLHPARGRVQQRPAEGGGRADRRRDLPPRDGGEHPLDRPRPRVQAHARAEPEHVPDGRPAAVRLRGEEDAAGPARLARAAAEAVERRLAVAVRSDVGDEAVADGQDHERGLRHRDPGGGAAAAQAHLGEHGVGPQSPRARGASKRTSSRTPSKPAK